MNAPLFRPFSLMLIGSLVLVACGTGTPTPTAAPPTGAPLPTGAPAATNTPLPTSAPAVTNTPALTETPAPTETPAATATTAVSATSAPTETPAATATTAPTVTTAAPQATRAAMNFVFVYYRLEVCTDWAPAFKIVNTGYATLSSYSLVIKNNTKKTSTTTVSNDFNQRQGCAVVSDTPSLTYGQVGYIYSKNFSYNPTGDDMTATVTVCTRDGQAGKCMQQVVNFTP